MNHPHRDRDHGWKQWLSGVPHYGLSLVVGIILTILVLSVWQALIRHEHGQIQQLVRQEASSIQAQIHREFSSRVIALERMALRWQVSGGTPRSLWEADATSYIHDIPGYQAIAWVDPALQPQWIIPVIGNEQSRRPSINQESRRRTTLEKARDTRTTTISPALELAQGGSGFLACIPLFRDRRPYQPNSGTFDGFIVGVFRFDTLFKDLIGETVYYSIDIWDDTDLIYRQGMPSPSQFTQRKTVTAYGTDWQIHVTPTSALLQSGRSPLPAVVLWGGVGAAWIVALLIHLGQRSERHAHRARQSNQQLQAEILHRQQVDEALAKELLRSQTLFNISLDGIVVMNDQGRVIQSSPSFAKMLGYSPAEVLTLSVIDWDAQWTPEELQAIINDDRPMPRFETRHRRKDGSIYDVEISYSKVKFDGAKMHFCICRDISDRKQSELELQHSQARFSGILEIASDAIISVNTQQQITLFNKGAEHIFGYAAAEVIGQPLSLLLPTQAPSHPPDPAHPPAQHDDHPYPMSPRNGVLGRRKDGSEFPAEASISKLNVNGDITFTTFLRDISNRQMAEAAMAHLAAIIEFSEDAIISKTLDGIITSWNQGAEKILGYTASDMVGKAITTIIPPASIADETYICDQIRQGHGIQHYDTQRIAKDGSLIDLSISISPIKNAQGKIIGASAIARDIRDRKHMEAARQQVEENLRHQKEMLQAIVNYIPVMIALFDGDGRIQFINPEFERILGWTLADWQERNILLDCYPDPADYETVIQHMLAANGHWKDFTSRTKTQQEIETSWTNVGLSNGLNLGIGQDISDRKHKEQALRQAVEAAESANLAKSIFLANMSHELRTPLNVILGFAQVMAHDPTLTPMQREDLQTIQRSGDHLLNLINDVLDLSKIEAGHCVLEETRFDLIALLHTLRTMMMEHAKSKQIQLSFEIAADVPQYVIADEQKLRQVLLNLLSNAIKFTPKGSVSLHVNTLNAATNTATTPLIVQFEVVDTGVGIKTEEQDSIFNAFVQAEAGRLSVSGTGLGLTISRKLLELMHGTISVQSTPMVGSIFTVQLPLQPTDSVEVQIETHNRTVIGLLPGQPHRRILIVDDQPENRLLMVRLLSQLGLDVREAPNGEAAIRIWQEWQPDLTWMDIRMPGLDGYEATKQIRAMEQGQVGVIIALTAQASHSDRALALAAGCNDYISKPFREETIFLKMREYLGLKYQYADAQPLPQAPDVDSCLNSDGDPSWQALAARISPTWLSQLQDAALCGNDRAIATLTTQLPPDLAPLQTYLIDLASKFQFEYILNWMDQVTMGGKDGNAN